LLISDLLILDFNWFGPLASPRRWRSFLFIVKRCF
jgi:hypothetical protein